MAYRNGEKQPDCPLYLVEGRHYRGNRDETYWWYVRRGLVLSNRIPEVGDLVIAMARKHPALVVVTQVVRSEEYTYDQYKAVLAKDPTHEPSAEVRQLCDRMCYYQTDSNPGVIAEFIPYTPRTVRAMAHDLGYDGDLGDDDEVRRVMHRASKMLLKNNSYKRLCRAFNREAANALASVLGLPAEEPKGAAKGAQRGAARESGHANGAGRGKPQNGRHSTATRVGRGPQQSRGSQQAHAWPADRRVPRPSHPASPKAIDAWLDAHPGFRPLLNASIAQMARNRVDVSGLTKRDVLERAIAGIAPSDLPCSYRELADHLLGSM